MVGMFIVVTFIIFLIIDVVVLKMQNKPHPAFGTITAANLLVFNDYNFDIPDNLMFSRSHTWLQSNDKGLIKIGVDDFVGKAIGAYSFSSFAGVDRDIKRGDTIFEISSGNRSIKIPSPIDCTLKSVNEGVLAKTNLSPYQDWGVQVKPKNNDDNLRQLIYSKDAAAWMKNEVKRLKGFMKGTFQQADIAGLTMYDGGTAVKSVITILTDKEFQNFQKEFLTL